MTGKANPGSAAAQKVGGVHAWKKRTLRLRCPGCMGIFEVRYRTIADSYRAPLQNGAKPESDDGEV